MQPLPFEDEVGVLVLREAATRNITLSTDRARCGAWPHEDGVACADQAVLWPESPMTMQHSLFASQPLFINITRQAGGNFTEDFAVGVQGSPLPQIYASPVSFPRCYGDGNCTGYALRFESPANFVTAFLSYDGPDVLNTRWYVRVENYGTYDPVPVTIWSYAQCACDVNPGSGTCFASNHSCVCNAPLVGAACVPYEFPLQFIIIIALFAVIAVVLGVGTLVWCRNKRRTQYVVLND